MALLVAYLFLLSLTVASLLTPLAARLARRWGIVDRPGPRKIHSGEIPLAGGWALFASMTLVLWGHLLGAAILGQTPIARQLPDPIPYFIARVPDLIAKIGWIYAGAAAIFALGLFDDLRGMSVRSRLAVQTAVAAALAALGVRPDLGFMPPWAAAAIGVVWIVGVTNSFNFLDGLDGLATSVALVATAALAAVLARGNQPNVAFYLAVLAGTQLGFLLHNWHPAKVFLGSSGSLLLGYLMAVSTLAASYMVGPVGNWLMPILTPLFILAVPLYDTSSVVLIRLLKGRSVAAADRSHFHHRLMRIGFTHVQAVVFISLIAFAIAISAVLLVGATPNESLLILVQIGGILLILVLAERVAQRARAELLERQRARTNEPLAEANASRDPEELP